MKKKSSSLILMFFYTIAYCQIGIGTNTPSKSAILDLNSNSKGFLTPRMSTIQRNAIVTPPVGLIIYNTDDFSFNTYNGTTLGWQDFTARYKTITSNSNTITASLSDVVASEMTISPPDNEVSEALTIKLNSVNILLTSFTFWQIHTKIN